MTSVVYGAKVAHAAWAVAVAKGMAYEIARPYSRAGEPVIVVLKEYRPKGEPVQVEPPSDDAVAAFLDTLESYGLDADYGLWIWR